MLAGVSSADTLQMHAAHFFTSERQEETKHLAYIFIYVYIHIPKTRSSFHQVVFFQIYLQSCTFLYLVAPDDVKIWPHVTPRPPPGLLNLLSPAPAGCHTLTSADPLIVLILQVSVLSCRAVVLNHRVFPHQVHDQDGLYEAQHHQSENPKAVDD